MSGSSNEYMCKYLIERYRQRRIKAILFLGGKCSKCGSIKKLELDHKDRFSKKFDIAKFWSVSKERFWKEIKKCQVLCKECHIKKTREDLGQQNARETHGTLSSYRYCKCRLCLKACRDWARKYRETHTRITVEGKRIWIEK